MRTHLADENSFTACYTNGKGTIRGGGIVLETAEESGSVGGAVDGRIHVELGAQSLVIDRWLVRRRRCRVGCHIVVRDNRFELRLTIYIITCPFL